MDARYTDSLPAIMQKILAAAPKSCSGLQKTFIEQFHAAVPPAELEAMQPEFAIKSALAAYDFAKTREQAGPQIRISESESASKSRPGKKRVVLDVVNDDMPFLVDSLSAELNRLHIRVYSLIHPVLLVKRGSHGQLLETQLPPRDAASMPEGYQLESIMRFELSVLPEDMTEKDLIARLHTVLGAVRLAVEDWQQMLGEIDDTISHLREHAALYPAEDITEAIDFLHWIQSGYFVILGSICYDFLPEGSKNFVRPVKGRQLGLFRSNDPAVRPPGLEALPEVILQSVREKELIEISKASTKSLVHRPVHLDYISLKRYDAKGNVCGEIRFIGLFTSTVYFQSAESVPIIRRKIIRTLDAAGYSPVSHNGKALLTILEFLPRDELFQIRLEELFTISLGIMALDTHPGVRLFIRRDSFERFLSCLVFIPREYFSTHLRTQIQHILEQASNGVVTAYYTQVTDSPLARLHVIVKTTPGEIPTYNLAEVERHIAAVTSPWHDAFRDALLEAHGERHGNQLFVKFGDAFPKAYITEYSPRSALHDVEKIQTCLTENSAAVDFFQVSGEQPEQFHLRIYNPREKLTLSDTLPILENLGFTVVDETPYHVTPDREDTVWIRDVRLRVKHTPLPQLEEIRTNVEDALLKIWQGAVENDAFNQLVVRAGLTWREVALLRAFAKYMRQINLPYSQAYVEQALANHPEIARMLVQLFYARFDPDRAQGSRAKMLTLEIDSALGNVSNLAEDRILRRFSDLLAALLRTNYFQTDTKGNPKDYFSFKFSSKAIPEMPLPLPFVEVFVYSTRVEGIHLRGGKVARGGLRWSDRLEDFRTEVLGLMKAQMVKNSVIVPVGSKGGFVVKQTPIEGGREAWLQEGVSCYQTFLRGILDITDNIVDGAVVPPKQLIRHDEDDPYLVVAADKGTATFSDIANGVSAEYGFWLADAFASGGSAGYDHKKMGITARGGWVSVMRHFREMGIDTQKDPFTVAGIGDMAGDVFGNGMLLSKQIKLVAAFNHMHIFIDPTPDPASSFKERKRLFNLPRSSWADYDSTLISKGGGIFERSAKSIPLSQEMRDLLGVTDRRLSPNQLIRAILMAPVDLLWNGGIGTYVKASSESHAEVGDPTNNALRVDARELHCKVVGEGGNLGLTQRARIEFALHGGRINTDAIDNSAGVDCSDHEVNIKIALTAAIEQKALKKADRDALLADMTDEVAELVLRDNVLQTQALTIAELQGIELLPRHARLMRMLERSGLLDRSIEFLPDDETIAERQAAGRGLTRPELSVLLAYSKLHLYADLMESNIPNDPYFQHDLIRYFPTAMRDRFEKQIKNHPLQREIVATVVTNSMVNRVGSTFFHGISSEMGVKFCDVARAYIVSRDCFNLRDVWADIEALDGKIDVSIQVEMFVEVKKFVERVTLWFLRNCPQPLNIGKLMKAFEAGVAEYASVIEQVISPAVKKAYQKKLDYYRERGVPKKLMAKMASLEALSSACDVVMVATQTKLPVTVVAGIYFELGAELMLGWLRLKASIAHTEDYWDRLAITTIINDLFDQQRRLTAEVIRSGCTDEACSTSVSKWAEGNATDIASYKAFIDDLRSHDSIDMAMLVIAARKVEAICGIG